MLEPVQTSPGIMVIYIMGSTMLFSVDAVFLSSTVISAPGRSALFSCSPMFGDALSIYWLVNATQFESLELRNVQSRVIEMNAVRTLEFSNIPTEYNVTSIQCVLNLTSGIFWFSNISSLIIQGKIKCNQCE